MSWIIANDYPYRSDTPELIESFDPPYPYGLLRCTGGVYPYNGIELAEALSPPYPHATYIIDGVTFDGRPYISGIPGIVDVFTLPGPWTFVKEGDDEYPKLLIREAVPAEFEIPSDDPMELPVTNFGQVDSDGFFTHPYLHRRIYTDEYGRTAHRYVLNIYGNCSWRTTETYNHDEESVECEIP